MKSSESMLLCVVAGLALCTTAGAVPEESAGSPYQGIVDRNVFGLKAPPPPPDPEANKPPPPKVFLTGITTILNHKRALMKLTPPAKPGEPAKEQAYTLGEGQRDGEVEVLQIDEVAGTVKANVYGTVMTLDFDNNGVKVAGTPAPGAGPTPPGFVPKPGATPFTPGGSPPVFPATRPLRLPTPTGAAVTPGSTSVTPVYANGATAPAGNPNVYAGGLALPGMTTPSYAATQPQQSTAPAMSAEAVTAMIEAQRLHYKSQNSPLAQLLPPTSIISGQTPATSGGDPGTAAPKPWTPPRAPSLPPLPQ